MTKLRIGILAVVLIALVAGLHYVVPQTDVVDIVNTEVKREDYTDSEGVVRTRDVYFIQTRLPNGNTPYVYRNEDNWLVFKFDSSNLQSRASSFARDSGPDRAAVRHYGWRIPFLSAYPNAISIWEPDPDYSPLNPFIPIILILGVAGAGIYAGGRYLLSKRPRWMRRRKPVE